MGRRDAPSHGTTAVDIARPCAHPEARPVRARRRPPPTADASPRPIPLRHLGEDLLKVNARQERLIDALLALARSDNGTAEHLPTDLGRVAEAVVDAAPLHGDPTLLEQLARNLVDNAIRSNRHGGAVHVTTCSTPEAAVLTVTNTGPTIGPHEVPTLFQPFRRLTDRVGSARGSGLGLSIVQAIAHTHGGEAGATPRPEGGLTVTVTLPRRRVRDQGAQPAPAGRPDPEVGQAGQA
ncbi:sensor histidine kinase [Actinacidiphila glaucinigra]|uniref:sensor histidine kinase n=1 Tax=Actinacidiphila glaucinigra TaxID=235986 RepID=UPI0037AB14A6